MDLDHVFSKVQEVLPFVTPERAVIGVIGGIVVALLVLAGRLTKYTTKQGWNMLCWVLGLPVRYWRGNGKLSLADQAVLKHLDGDVCLEGHYILAGPIRVWLRDGMGRESNGSMVFDRKPGDVEMTLAKDTKSATGRIINSDLTRSGRRLILKRARAHEVRIKAFQAAMAYNSLLDDLTADNEHSHVAGGRACEHPEIQQFNQRTLGSPVGNGR